jgi:hypothetical protein
MGARCGIVMYRFHEIAARFRVDQLTRCSLGHPIALLQLAISISSAALHPYADRLRYRPAEADGVDLLAGRLLEAGS